MSTSAINKPATAEITDADMQTALAALQTLQETLAPYLVNLSTDQKRGLAKMGSKSIDFVSKTLSYANAHPQFRPAFVDLDEFSQDVAAFSKLRLLQQPMSQFFDMVDDSLALAGSDALTAALAIYQTIKTAAKLNVLGAGTIADDLAARFANQGNRGPATTPAPVTAQA
jgi:hypothetical protein